ncbi:hypothetical protein GS898_13275 [Rhodococcus hoagii]|nr:hypothetical protein [Prescottella equi]
MAVSVRPERCGAGHVGVVHLAEDWDTVGEHIECGADVPELTAVLLGDHLLLLHVGAQAPKRAAESAGDR